MDVRCERLRKYGFTDVNVNVWAGPKVHAKSPKVILVPCAVLMKCNVVTGRGRKPAPSISRVEAYALMLQTPGSFIEACNKKALMQIRSWYIKSQKFWTAKLSSKPFIRSVFV